MTQHQPVIFFIDRCLECTIIVETLRQAGIKIEIHRDHFLDDAQDVDWLPKVGENGWVVLTKDSNISRNRIERNAVALAGVKMFTLKSASLTGETMSEIFLKAIVNMQDFVRENPAPFIAKVNSAGKVESYKNSQTLLEELN